MWLDRLSSNSTPSGSPPPPANRFSDSVAKRATSSATNNTVQRPGGPRSSLSLSSNGRFTPIGAKKVNGSDFKRINSEQGIKDPLDVLNTFLKSKAIHSLPAPTASTYNAAEQDEVLELDFGGLSLSQFVADDFASKPAIQVAQTAVDYQRDKENYEDLHRSIRACDEVLSSVETNLTSFQKDLATVAAEIESLQAHSTILNIRLENRKVVEQGLGPVVEEISVSPAIVKKIMDGVIDEGWVKALAEVEKRSMTMEAKSTELQLVKGAHDLRPVLKNLIAKSMERIRDFLVAQIKALRSPNINAQFIQQQHFIRYKVLYSFLARHHSQLAGEIGQAYMNTMRWYFLNQFTRYGKALEKVKLHILDKYDVIGNEDRDRKSSILSSNKVARPPHDAFNLGHRIDLLKTSNQMALSSFLAEEDKNTYYFETPFRNFNLALIDNASAEYSFLTSFFAPTYPNSTISKYFNYIFEPTFALGQSMTKSLITETFDCLGLLLCVRLNQHFAFELQQRKIPAVDGYINGTRMLLWPRFQVVMDQHCESLRTATASISVRKPSSSEAAKQSAAPHLLTQRFGHFMQGILSLSTEAGDDGPVSASLNRLRSEMEAFLTKTSQGIGDARKERFLYNNYSLISTIISDLEGKLAFEEQDHFEARRKAFDNAV